MIEYDEQDGSAAEVIGDLVQCIVGNHLDGSFRRRRAVGQVKGWLRNILAAVHTGGISVISI